MAKRIYTMQKLLSISLFVSDTQLQRYAENWVRQHSFVEIDHEIFSMAILSLLLIQEGQLSVSGKRMCTHTG